MKGFTDAEVERARRYHRPLYVALLADAVLGFALLAALAFLGEWAYRPFERWPWAVRTVAYAAVVVLLLAVLRLPLSFWRGYVYERRWGFSTQTLRGWLVDRAKALAVSVALTPAALLGLVAVARWLPRTWPLVAAPGAALLVLALGVLAPVLLEPLFNRFARLAGRELAAELRALAERAAVPVREVLVADASRRTRKSNAYVSGLGRTRRVVLYDTLLARADPRQIQVVVAHELGHRRARHVAKATVLAMAGAAAAVVVWWAIGRDAANPRSIPLLLLVVGVLEVLALPFSAALSRRWERQADRFSLELTRDRDAFERAHRELATANLADLAPPRAVYLLLFTHPTPPERIEAANRWAAAVELGMPFRRETPLEGR
ncbi:MAG TPA: M48 family metalloprotease [Gaiellaceae bacterium]